MCLNEFSPLCFLIFSIQSSQRQIKHRKKYFGSVHSIRFEKFRWKSHTHTHTHRGQQTDSSSDELYPDLWKIYTLKFCSLVVMLKKHRKFQPSHWYMSLKWCEIMKFFAELWTKKFSFPLIKFISRILDFFLWEFLSVLIWYLNKKLYIWFLNELRK